jgi:hypothetical protein
MRARTLARDDRAGAPAALRLALVLAFPFIGALTVAGTYLGKEIIVAAAWVALATVGFLFVNPVSGVIVMSAMFLITAYPTLLQTLGILTVNNLIGLGFVVLLVLHVLETRDMSFLRIPQVQILIVIGILFAISGYHSDINFPLLVTTFRRGGATVDRTADLSHDYVTRLAFLGFFWVFVRSRRDISALFLTFTFVLFAAIPSALINWEQGTLESGFRAQASLTAGANANRLAMICYFQIACWWVWAQSHPGWVRRAIGYGVMGASGLVLFATGSRSGLVACVPFAILLQTGVRRFRVTPVQMGFMGVLVAVAVVAIVPPEAWERMLNFTPGRGEAGQHSTLQRVTTIYTGVQMIQDYPGLGVGLGNFREVAKQVYRDPFYRPPHNSYLWAASEGGIPVLLLYLLLMWVTWRDVRVITKLAHRDPSIAHIAAGMRIVFPIFNFFGLFADLWLNPILYIMVGLVITLRRHVEGLPEVQAPARMVPTRRAIAVAA